MSQVELHINGTDGGRLELRSILGARSLLRHTLAFDLQYHVRMSSQGKPITFHGFRGALSSAWADGTIALLCPLFPPDGVQTFYVQGRDQELTVRLAGLIDSSTLDELERMRNGGAMTLQLMVGCEAEVDGTLNGVTARLNESLSRHRWAEILEQCGYGTVTWISVPALHETASGPLATASRQFGLAIKKMAGDDWAGCIAQCRLVAETLGKRGRRATDADSQPPKRAQEKSKTERVRDLTDSLRNLAGGAHHEDTIKASEWSRADAELALRVAASLLSHASSGAV